MIRPRRPGQKGVHNARRRAVWPGPDRYCLLF